MSVTPGGNTASREIEDDSSHDGDNLQVVRQRPWPPSLDSREDRQEAIVLSRVDDHGQRCRYRDGHGQRSARGEIGHRLCNFGDGVGPVRERDSPLELLNVDHVVREGIGELSDNRSRASRRLTRFIEGFSSVGIGGKAIIGAQSDRRLGSRTRGRLRAGPGKKLRSFELDGRRAASDGPARLASDELTTGAPADLYHRVVWPIVTNSRTRSLATRSTRSNPRHA